MNATRNIELIGGPASGQKQISYTLSNCALIRVPCYGVDESPSFFCHAMYGVCTIPRIDPRHKYIFIGWDDDGQLEGGMG